MKFRILLNGEPVDYEAGLRNPAIERAIRYVETTVSEANLTEQDRSSISIMISGPDRAFVAIDGTETVLSLLELHMPEIKKRIYTT